MPFSSRQQAKWAHSSAGKEAGFTPKRLAEWSAKTDFKHLPKRSKHKEALKRALKSGRG